MAPDQLSPVAHGPQAQSEQIGPTVTTVHSGDTESSLARGQCQFSRMLRTHNVGAVTRISQSRSCVEQHDFSATHQGVIGQQKHGHVPTR